MKIKLVPKLIKSFIGFGRGAEGSNRGPFTFFGEFGSPAPLGPLEDGWQRGLNDSRSGVIPIVYACVMANARAVSICRAHHVKITNEGDHVEQRDSWAARLIRNPNTYETWNQLFTNIVSEMLYQGESLVMIVRDERFVPVALHRIQHGSWQPHLDPESREVYYAVSSGGNPLSLEDSDYVIPSRDVIHFRQHTPRHPLIGETPLKSAAMAVGINVALSNSQVAFFNQMRRPSGIISTEEKLNVDQLKQLRQAFDNQSQYMRQGGIPILASGLKFQSMAISSQDAQVIDAQRMTIEDVARVFGVPLPVVGDLSKATLNNAETLINHWLAMGLGSLLENIEQSLDKAFKFGHGDHIEFSTDPLLRSDFISKVEGLTKSIQGGLLSVNEARSKMGKGPVENGDEPMVQSQMVTVGYAAEKADREQQAAEADKARVDAMVSAAAQPNPEPAQEPKEEKQADPDVTKALVVDLFARKRA